MSFWNINEIYITCVTVWGIEHNTILVLYTFIQQSGTQVKLLFIYNH